MHTNKFYFYFTKIIKHAITISYIHDYFFTKGTQILFFKVEYFRIGNKLFCLVEIILKQLTFTIHICRYTLDLQGSCKEECGSDYIGGLTIKNKTLPRDVSMWDFFNILISLPSTDMWII